LKGTLGSDGMMQMFREYTPVLDRRKSTGATPKAKTPRATPGAPTSTSAAFPTVTQQREGAGRIRKQSSLMKENIESMTPRTSATGIKQQVKPSAPVTGEVIPSSSLQKQDSSRTQRTSAPMLKCMDILRELMKYPHGAWFLEPVDYVKLLIPGNTNTNTYSYININANANTNIVVDYPTIITKPMDFSTVKSQLEGNNNSNNNNSNTNTNNINTNTNTRGYLCNS